MSAYTDLYRARQDIKFRMRKIKNVKAMWEDYEALSQKEKNMTKELKRLAAIKPVVL